MKSGQFIKAPQSPPKIMGTGLIALDIILDADRNLLSYGLGGSVGNVLSILASLGWSSSPVGKLGCDVAAEIILDEFRSLKANLELIVQEHSAPTPVIYQHQLDNPGGRTHKFSFACPVCGEKRPWHSPAIQLPPKEVLDAIRPNVVYMDRVTPIGIQIAEYYKSQNVLIFFEPSAVGNDPKLFKQALAVADVVKYADDRLDDLEAFDRSHIFVEICTMGSDGLRFRAPSLGNDWVRLDAFSAPAIIDTSGAGDWCTSGMLHYLFDRDLNFSIGNVTYNRLNEALRFGQALSALNCMAMGARGLAKSLPRSKINNLASELQRTKIDSGLFEAETEATSILHEGWSSLITNRLTPKGVPNLRRNHGLCCHTAL
ncbi:MAG TPA: hypothetical protein VMV97_09600 [Sulfuriferula sp.]|nr:hypothetical protein [Sulfuriferula sp.]